MADWPFGACQLQGATLKVRIKIAKYQSAPQNGCIDFLILISELVFHF